MSQIEFDFEVKSNAQALKKRFPELVDRAVRAAAFVWEAEAKKTLREGHGVDTGAMRAAISVATSRNDDLTQNLGQARSLYASKHTEPFPVGELPSGKPPRCEAWVISPAAYSVYQEFGTRFVTARRFMRRGMEKARKALEQGLDELEGRL